MLVCGCQALLLNGCTLGRAAECQHMQLAAAASSTSASCSPTFCTCRGLLSLRTQAAAACLSSTYVTHAATTPFHTLASELLNCDAACRLPSCIIQSLCEDLNLCRESDLLHTLLAAMSSSSIASHAATTRSHTLASELPFCVAACSARPCRRLAASLRLTAVGRLQHTGFV